jgi:hypothetical protein
MDKRTHPDWQPNHAAGAQCFRDGIRDRHAVKERYRDTAKGHLVIRLIGWREGYAEAAQAAGADLGTSLDSVG